MKPQPRSSFLLGAVMAALCLAIAPRAGEKKYSIDLWLEKAIDKDSSTAGMRKATQQAERMWDQELNKTYRRLSGRLKPRQRAALLQSQKAWLAFRDAEFRYSDRFFELKEGTMWQPVSDHKRLEVVKARVLELQDYERLLKE